jgi:hypothetical protein
MEVSGVVTGRKKGVFFIWFGWLKGEAKMVVFQLIRLAGTGGIFSFLMDFTPIL